MISSTLFPIYFPSCSFVIMGRIHLQVRQAPCFFCFAFIDNVIFYLRPCRDAEPSRCESCGVFKKHTAEVHVNMASQAKNSHSSEFSAPESQDSSMSDEDEDSNHMAPAPAQVSIYVLGTHAPAPNYNTNHMAPAPAQVLEYVSTMSEEDSADASEPATVHTTETDSLSSLHFSAFSDDDDRDTDSYVGLTDPDWEIQVEADDWVFAAQEADWLAAQQMDAQQMDAMDAQQNPPP